MRNLKIENGFLTIIEDDLSSEIYEVESAKANRNDNGLVVETNKGTIEILQADAGVNNAAFVSNAALVTWFYESLSKNVVSGSLVKCTASFTTAVGAVSYAAGDVINAPTVAATVPLQSINMGCNSGYITGLAIEMDNSAPLSSPSPLPTLRMRLFDATDASLAIADNAADETLYSNNVRRLGFIDLPIMVVEGGRLVVQDENIRFPFANLTNGLLYYKIINMVGAPTLGTASVGRGVFIRMKVDKNI
jgi:hypothetical protein